MSKTLHKPLFLIIVIFVLHIFTTIHSKPFSFTKQKQTHLHFYFHDIVTGRHPTAVKVASAPTTNTTLSFFGLVMMMDDPLTMGPEPESKLVGRAQGMYASADLKELGLLMVLNYCFVEGKYNGSTLSILGRNAAFTAVREMPIVGGTGLFRFARGYAQAKTHSADFKTGNAVVEYDVLLRWIAEVARLLRWLADLAVDRHCTCGWMLRWNKCMLVDTKRRVGYDKL